MVGQTLPTGRVTLLFTDIEGSTRLLDALGDRFGDLVAEHRRILREAVARNGGTEVGTQGDGHTAVFTDGVRAISAAVDAQIALERHSWPDGLLVRVRMGLHTGDVALARDEYYGMGLHAAARVSSAAHGGQILVSEDARDAVAEQLAGSLEFVDLGLHALKDLGPPRRLYQVVHAALDRDFPPPASLGVLPNNLPTALPSFVGREREIASIIERLGTARLVTVTGPGGVGKTRTCLQVVAQLVDRFDHGAWLIDLSSLERDDVVARAVANALGVRDEPGRSLRETLEDKLRWREMVLLIDNCEHVIDDCATSIASLMRACPGLRVLATTREPLQIEGESLFVLEPFSDADDDAVRLFIERASAVGAQDLSSADRALVEEVCRRVDGLALAIELAAARTDVLSVGQILERLDQPRFLSGRSRSAPERQRSLDALIDWSYELLGPAERSVMRRCAVFAGGFTLEAAEAVCRGEGFEVVDALSSLARASLLVVQRGERGVRYRQLEAVRRYALDRSTEAGERRSSEEALIEYFSALVRRVGPQLDGPKQTDLLDSLTDEFGNLSAAIEWSIVNGAPDSAVGVVDALRRFWIERGHLHAALDWSRRLSPLEISERWEGRLLVTRGFLEGIVGDSDEGVALARRAIDAAVAGNDDVLEDRATSVLGTLLDRRGEHEEAERVYARSAEIATRIGDRISEASAWGNLGNVAFERGEYERAEELQLRALRLAEEAAAPRVISNTLSNLGLASWVRGDLERARLRFEQALAIARGFGSAALPSILGNIGGVARDIGDLDRAQTVLHEAIALAEHGGDPAALGSSLVSLATVLWDAGDREGARVSWTRGLDVARASGIPSEELGALLNLAELAAEDGDLDEAHTLGTQMLELARRTQNARREGDAIAVLAGVASERHAYEEAERLAGEALAIYERIGDLHGRVEVSSRRAEVLAALGRPDEALAVIDDVEELLQGQESWRLVETLQLRCAIALEREEHDAARRAAAKLEALIPDAPAPMRPAASRCVADVRAVVGELTDVEA